MSASPSTSLAPKTPTHSAVPRAIPLSLAGLTLLLGHWPLLYAFFAELWTRQQYQFYPALLAAAALFAAERFRRQRDPLSPPDTTSLAISLTLFTAAFTLLAVGGLLRVRLFAPLAAWLSLAAAAWWIGGRPLARALLPVGLFLLLVIPPPFHLDVNLTYRLRAIAVHASGAILDRIGIPHLVSGNMIEIPNRRLMVEEACSGINSVMSVAAFACALCLLHGYGLARLLTLLLSAVALVLWANIVRITIATAVLARTGVDLFAGAVHVLFGWGIFVTAVALVYAIDHLWSELARRKPRDGRGATKVKTSQPSSRPPTAPSIRCAAALTLCAAFLAVGLITRAQLAGAWSPPRLPASASFQLPARLGSWERVDTAKPSIELGQIEGSRSFVWTFRNGPLAAVVALDYPFLGYHDNTICYASTGWKIRHRQSADVAAPCERVEMGKPPLLKGVLRFGLCDESGRWLTSSADGSRVNGLTDLRGNFENVRRVSEAPHAYQVQLLTESYVGWSSDEEAVLDELFQAARALIRAQLLKQIEASSPTKAP